MSGRRGGRAVLVLVLALVLVALVATAVVPPI
jgi:hypothetical protein